MTLAAGRDLRGVADARGLELRAPAASDRDRIEAIVRATQVFREDEIEIALEVLDGAVTAPGTDYWAVVAVHEGQVVGWAAFGPVPCTVATWDLYWIAVDPALHGGGIGRQLMAHCESAITAEGGRLIVVETSSRVAYEPTRAFYERLGYHAQASIPEYYAAGDGLVVYTKSLEPSAHG